jgi:DNA polymerase
MSVTQQQLVYLNAMGIPVWVSRAAVDSAIVEITSLDESADKQPSLQQQSSDEVAAPIPIPTEHSPRYQQQTPSPVISSKYTPPAAFSTENLFNEIDQAIAPNSAHSITSIADSLKTKVIEKQLIDCTNFNWQQLEDAVTACQQCELYNKRTQVVFGDGEKQATWMIIGDAPKEEEDMQGRPFMDRSGMLLDNMLAAIGLDRASVYVANTLKCRPPNHRDPKKGESKACYGYIKRQIELVNPSLILIVGRIAAQRLLKTTKPLAQLRGRQHQLPELNIPVVVTYHPRYLLRQPRDKYKSWQDLKLALTIMKRLRNMHEITSRF